MSKIELEAILFFSQLIEKEIGIQYNEINRHLLENRLHDLAKNLGFQDFSNFWQDLKGRSLRTNERDLLLDMATNNETTFFRDTEIFEYFRNEFLPKFKGSTLRIWCAASSTGQEPYSLSMTLSEYKMAGGAIGAYEILATDYSERVLQQAKLGIYSQLEVQRGLAPNLLARYFEPYASDQSTMSKFKIKSEISRSVVFKRTNLLEPWHHRDAFNIIFCRNVLIYQDIENKRKIISRLAESLTPGGILVLGGAESLLGLSSDFEMQIFGKACTYKLKSTFKASA